MGKLSITVGLSAWFFAATTLAMPCPDALMIDQFGDQDWDGQPNEIDMCCFTASIDLGGGTVAHCGSSDPFADDNGNGIARDDEGMCCVKNPWECRLSDNTNGCPADSGAVPCDKLLKYGLELDTFECPDGSCVCSTVDDFDHDGSGPYDNCPLSQLSGSDLSQENSDGDIWGDECDSCERDDPVGFYAEDCWDNMYCGTGARCVPFVTLEYGEVTVRPVCSSPPDYDGDGHVQTCDNCDDVWNASQENRDGDLWGDACDGCPGDYDSEPLDGDDDGIWDSCDLCNVAAEFDTDGAEDRDSDGIPDDCDNCPGEFDTEQLDTDSDGIGDRCDNCGHEWNQSQSDRDGDGVGDKCDMCPERDDDHPVFGEDIDGDLIADQCDMCPGRLDNEAIFDESDQDSDGVADECDVCPGYNNAQLPVEIGVAAELFPDVDHDGVADLCDACPGKYDDQATIGRPDEDQDGIPDLCDMCPHMQNTKAAMGEDRDRDGIADFCDELVDIDTDEDDQDTDELDQWVHGDLDEDGVVNGEDNCPEDFNPAQDDFDEDGDGDACSPFDDYTGAFTCRCSNIGAKAPESASSLKMLLQLLI